MAITNSFLKYLTNKTRRLELLEMVGDPQICHQRCGQIEQTEATILFFKYFFHYYNRGNMNEFLLLYL